MSIVKPVIKFAFLPFLDHRGNSEHLVFVDIPERLTQFEEKPLDIVALLIIRVHNDIPTG